MRMADMIPELEDLVDTGIVTKTTALALVTYVELKGFKHGKKGFS